MSDAIRNGSNRPEYSSRDEELAAKIHYSLIPENVDNDYVFIDTKQVPFAKVGGDYCSIIHLSDTRLMMNMCDVSGHGIAAALLATRINSFVLSQSHDVQHPCELLCRLNEFIHSHFYGHGIFATYFSLWLDFEEKSMVYAGGGHPPVLYYNAREATITPLKSETTPLGIEHPFVITCRVERQQIGCDDRIILYTDGVMDVTISADERFGLARLQETVQKYHDLVPAALNQQIVRELFTVHKGAQTDDIMIMSAAIK